MAATSIGVRPTFGAGERTVEAFILDFDGDLYGREVGLEFVGWLRPEERFDTVELLQAQVQRDVGDTRAMLEPSAGAQGARGWRGRSDVDDALRHRLLRRGVTEVIVESELVELLDSGRPLRLKMGFDPSAPDLHMGHAVGLRKLRQLQELGHRVVVIVGDWTAQIGDPSGRSATRPMLTREQVLANAETYLAQFFKIVDRERTETRLQSDWFGPFSLADVLRLTSRFTVAQILARDDFAKRYDANQPIAVTELLYPMLQAYDSIEVEADVELGGTDQKFNLLLGRDLQEMVGQRAQQCLHDAPSAGHRRRPEDEQEPGQLRRRGRPAERDVPQDDAAARLSRATRSTRMRWTGPRPAPRRRAWAAGCR